MKFFDIDDRTHGDRTATGAICLFDALAAKDRCAGRKVWPLDVLQKVFEQLFLRGIWVG